MTAQTFSKAQSNYIYKLEAYDHYSAEVIRLMAPVHAWYDVYEADLAPGEWPSDEVTNEYISKLTDIEETLDACRINRELVDAETELISWFGGYIRESMWYVAYALEIEEAISGAWLPSTRRKLIEMAMAI